MCCRRASSALNSKGSECDCDASWGASSSTNQRSNPKPRKSNTNRDCGVTMAFKDCGETEGRGGGGQPLWKTLKRVLWSLISDANTLRTSSFKTFKIEMSEMFCSNWWMAFYKFYLHWHFLLMWMCLCSVCAHTAACAELQLDDCSPNSGLWSLNICGERPEKLWSTRKTVLDS